MLFESSSSANTVFNIAHSTLTETHTGCGLFGIIIAVVFTLILLYIIAVIIGSILAAVTSGICTC